MLPPTRDRGPRHDLRRTISTTSHPSPLPHHVGGGDLQGNWDNSSPNDTHVATLPYKRWVGLILPTFTPRQQPLQASCHHLTIWGPQRISRQMVGAVTVRTAFLDHHGGLGTLHLPNLTTEALTPPLARLSRVPLFLSSATGTHSRRMEIKGGGGLSNRHLPSKGHGSLNPGLPRTLHGEQPHMGRTRPPIHLIIRSWPNH